METSMEKGFSALGGLFQSVINDLKIGMPLWEDFLTKAAKLHSQLKATILATSTFLDAFQKIADLATNTRGATKDIGTALTRIIMRHKAVEARLKTFTSSILDCLVLPLQEKMEEWKKTITHLDKEHAKEYKKARQEIKKRSSDTLRLQKKARKGKSDIQRTLDNALQEVTDKFVILEEIEKQAVRTVLIEERSHFCLLVACLKPVVDEEVAMLSEIMHLQEILEQLMKHASDPFTLPQPTEQLINDIKGSENCWAFQTPPSSPSSLGSRKSSICSISSLNSSSSGSTKSHSPSHQLRHRVHAQQQIAIGTLRLSSVSSQDSGFTSQDTLFLRPPTPPPLELARQVMCSLEANISPDTSSSSSTPSPHFPMVPIATATWPNLQETMQFDKTDTSSLILAERPHTISSAYERGHQRPALTIHTFQPPDKLPNLTDEYSMSNSSYLGDEITPTAGETADECPPIPERFVILEKPTVPEKSGMKSLQVQQHLVAKTPVPDFNQPAPNQIVPQPIYTNLDEIENSRSKLDPKSSAVIEQMQKQLPQQAELVAALTQGLQERKVHRSDSEGSTSHVSLLSSSGYGSQSTVATTSDDKLPTEVITEFVFDRSCMDEASKYCTIPRYSDHSQMLAHVAGMKPCTTGHPSVTASQSAHCTIKSSMLRRSNSQTHKPPLPIRRTSSITSQHGLTVVALRNQQAGAATLPRAASAVSDGICRGQLRQLSDNSIDNLVTRKNVFDDHLVADKRVENHVASNKSLSARALNKKDSEEKEKPSKDSSDSQLAGKVANTIKELEEYVTFKSTNSVLQEHIVAKINSMINHEQNNSWKNNQNTNGAIAHNGTRKNSVSSQSSSQSDGEIALANAEALKNEIEGSHPSSPRVSSHRPGTPRTTTSNVIATNLTSSSGGGSPRTNSPRMGSLARRMSEPGRFQALDESIASSRASLIQSLNAKLSGQQEYHSNQAPPATLPKPQRAQSESSQHESFLQNLNAKLAQQIQKQQGPISTVQQNEKQSFKENLNAKLIQQCRLDSGDAGRVMTRRASVGDAAARVRQWMANRPSVDPATCRESLLDQIRRGASLRKASTNDRSSPRIQ